MIILVTGRPGTGKTTVLERFLPSAPEGSVSVLSKELRDTQGNRIGFEGRTSAGKTGIFAHKTDVISEMRVGTFLIDLPVVDELFTRTMKEVLKQAPPLFVLDEIGPMQLCSSRFKEVLDKLFASPLSFLATIKKDDVSLERYKQHDDVILFEVTDENRESLPKILKLLVTQAREIESLNPARKKRCFEFLSEYARTNQRVQLQKCAQHAVVYVNEGRIEKQNEGQWLVHGDHQDRIVHLRSIQVPFTCNCELFLGRHPYAGMPGPCAHVQAVELFEIK